MRVIDIVFVFLALVATCMGVCNFSGNDFILSDVTGHYYRVLECFNESWMGANTFAQSIEHPTNGYGYLMTINNYDEQNVIYTRLSAPGFIDIFVGGIDAAGDNNWIWTGPPSTQFYMQARGCISYCNFDVNYPTAPATIPQGLRLRSARKWVSAPVYEVVPWAYAFVEFGCCDCGLRGTCDESTCTCTCSDNYVGDQCETYIGGCKYPDSPICDPITPVCVKPSSTLAPTYAPTYTPTYPPSSSCQVSVSSSIQSGYPLALSDGGSYGVVDIIVVNTGSQVATRAYFTINYPSTAYITTWWNFARIPPTYIDLPDLQPGDTYSIGKFMLEDPGNADLIVSLVFNDATC